MRLVRSFSILFIMVFLFCFSVSNVYAIDSSQLPSIPSVEGYNYFLVIDRFDMGYVKTLPDGKQARYALILFTKDCPVYVCTTSAFNERFGDIFNVDSPYKNVFLNVAGSIRFYDLVDGEWVFQYEENYDWFRFGGSPVTKDITPLGLFGNVKVYNLDGTVFYSPEDFVPVPVSDDVIVSIDELKQFLAIQFGFFIGVALAYTFLKFMYS